MPDGATIRTLIVKGVPMGLQLFVISLSGVLMITLVNRFGTDTTAAFGATFQLWQYVQMPAFAIGMAVSSMAAQNVGAQKWDRVRAVARHGVWFSILLTTTIVVVIEVFSEQALGIFLPAGSVALRTAEHLESDRRVVVHPAGGFDGAVRRGARDGGGASAAGDPVRWRCWAFGFRWRCGCSMTCRPTRSGGASRFPRSWRRCCAIAYYKWGGWRTSRMGGGVPASAAVPASD